MDLATLLAEREIHLALCRFARAMDERDWAALDDVIAEHATADFGTGLLQGRTRIVADMRSYLDVCGPTQHLLGNLVVEVAGDRAASRCYVRDLHLGTGAMAAESFSSSGEYRDRWERGSSGWRMVHRHKATFLAQGSIGIFGSEKRVVLADAATAPARP